MRNGQPVPGAPGARAAMLVLAVTVSVVVLMHAQGLTGGFLSDDYGLLDLMLRNERAGTLGAWLVERFFGPLPGTGNFGYRPIGFLSFALDWRLYGVNPSGWHVTSLLLHLANVALVALLVARWLAPAPSSRVAAAFAAATFAAYPFAGEATFWIAARFDLIAALFGLLFLATLDGGPSPAGPLRQVLRIALLGAALLGKESAMPLPAIALVADAALARGPSAADLRGRIAFALRDMAPSMLALVIYFGWRTVLFGTPVKVYPHSSLPQNAGEYLDRLAMLGAMLTRQSSAQPSWTFALVAGALTAVLVAAALLGRRRIGTRGAMVTAAALLGALAYVLAPALSFPSSTIGGEGSRNYYIGWALASVALGVGASATAVTRMTAAALVAWLLVGQAGSLGQWQEAGREMNAVTRAVPAFAEGVGTAGYALLLLPDRIGAAVFARNAQGGIVSRPVQPENYLDRVAGMTQYDFASWRSHFRDGTIARLKGAASFDPARFAGVFCWSPGERRFVRVSAPGAIADPGDWEREVRSGVARSSCLPGTVDDA